MTEIYGRVPGCNVLKIGGLVPGCNVLKIGGLGQNNYYALMAKEFRALGVHVPINTLINTS